MPPDRKKSEKGQTQENNGYWNQQIEHQALLQAFDHHDCSLFFTEHIGFHALKLFLIDLSSGIALLKNLQGALSV